MFIKKINIMAKLNANQIALVIFMGWYISEDTFLNAAHRNKLGRIIDDILHDHDMESITETVFDEVHVPVIVQEIGGKAIEDAYENLVTKRVKEGNLPDDLERLMIRLTTMDLKLITEETILSTVKAWNYGN